MLDFLATHPWLPGWLLLLGAVFTVLWLLRRGDMKRQHLLTNGKGQVIRWPHYALPLTVLVVEQVPEHYLASLTAVSRFINQRCRMALFKLPARVDAALAQLKAGTVAVSLGAVAATHHQVDRNGFISAALLTLPPGEPATSDQLYPIILHELLHVLGLEHNGSAPNPALVPATRMLTDMDTRLLLELYGTLPPH